MRKKIQMNESGGRRNPTCCKEPINPRNKHRAE
jgi:hypothetical protein